MNFFSERTKSKVQRDFKKVSHAYVMWPWHFFSSEFVISQSSSCFSAIKNVQKVNFLKHLNRAPENKFKQKVLHI